MSYRSPVADILFSLKHVAGLDEAIESGLFGDLDVDTVAAVISEAGRFATEAIAPLDRVGDLDRRASARTAPSRRRRAFARPIGNGPRRAGPA